MSHALVIGGTKGLGRVVARQFAERGDTVSVIGRSDMPEGDLSAGNIKSFKADINNNEALTAVLQEVVRTNGKINYCVFLQRYRGQGDDWEGELHTTLTTTKNAIEILITDFSESGDNCIIMVSSVFSTFVGEGQAVSYHVAKAGMDQMMRYYALNLGAKGIRVNGISPFTFLKEESKHFYQANLPLMKLYKDIVPLQRLATTEDSANVVSFLCSPKAGFLTGQNIVVDGGLSLAWPETLARKLTNI
jgi:NAD(P)-dependent dehydrogenase (short-subunit alcohol dehydrogenase family)